MTIIDDPYDESKPINKKALEFWFSSPSVNRDIGRIRLHEIDLVGVISVDGEWPILTLPPQ